MSNTEYRIYEQDVKELMELADEMAAAMTSLNPHNYLIFVQSRDKFKEKAISICIKNRKAA